MTTNQLAYWKLQEDKRANLAKEQELKRSNVAREDETKRSNLATESERMRSNRMNETISSTGNVLNYAANKMRNDEQVRHNKATEKQAVSELRERKRSNRANEKIAQTGTMAKVVSTAAGIATGLAAAKGGGHSAHGIVPGVEMPSLADAERAKRNYDKSRIEKKTGRKIQSYGGGTR